MLFAGLLGSVSTAEALSGVGCSTLELGELSFLIQFADWNERKGRWLFPSPYRPFALSSGRFGYRPLCLLISVNYVSGFCSKKPKIKLCKCYGCNQCGRLWALDRNAERYEAHVRTQKNFLRRFPISYS